MKPPVALVGLALATLALAGCAGGSAEAPQADPTNQTTGSPPADLTLAVSFEQRSGSDGAIVPASCVAGVAYGDTFYAVTKDAPGIDDPEPDEPLDGVVIPGCNDTGYNLEPDTPVDAWSIDGVSIDRAILVDWP